MSSGSRLEAVLFDVDGTLLPTLERQEAWFLHYSEIQRKSWPFPSLREFRDFYNERCARDGGVQNVYDELGLPCSIRDRSHSVWSAYNDFIASHPLALYPGMAKALTDIWEMGGLQPGDHRNRRLRLALNTTNTWKVIAPDLAREGVLRYFDTFVTKEVLDTYHGAGNGAALHKPSKISIALSLSLLGSTGATTMHVGDTRSDLLASQEVVRVEPSRRETLLTVGACYGYEERRILEEGAETPDGKRVHFDYLIDKPSDLVSLVEQHLKK